jgi:hypothetical protein
MPTKKNANKKKQADKKRFFILINGEIERKERDTIPFDSYF